MIKYPDIDPDKFKGRTSVKPNELKGKRKLTRIVPYAMVKKATPPDIGIEMYRLEANRYRVLQWRLAHKEIKAFEYQTPRYPIINTRGRETYVQFDFLITRGNSSQYIHECKGRLGAPQLARYKLFAKQHPGLYCDMIFEVSKKATENIIKLRISKSRQPRRILFEAQEKKIWDGLVGWQSKKDWDLMIQLQQTAKGTV
jgi:hypothetical protein